MGESTCLMQQPFSYSAPQGDSSFVGALGQSVSFGRFMSEKLDWEKWSAFSTQNPYVAEAKLYSKPGSVAQKKAFFEAHYKKLAAARKAAAAAAQEALLLQQQNLKPEPEKLPAQQEDHHVGGSPRGSLDDAGMRKVGMFSNKQSSDEKENLEEVEEKPILKKQAKSSSKARVSIFNSSERTPRSKSNSYTFTPVKEFNRLVSIIKKIDGSRASSKLTKDCKTPLRTPSHKVSGNELVEYSLRTPLSSNTRGKTGPHSSAKASRGKWNFLPAETPSCFTPFGLRTEERAERRKKKLEEKYKAMEVDAKSVEKQESKVGQRLCFKAKPLPDFYKKRPKSTDKPNKVSSLN